MSGGADTGLAPRDIVVAGPADQVAAIFGLLWLLLQLAVIRSMVSAELASTAIRLQDATSGGAHGAHQV